MVLDSCARRGGCERGEVAGAEGCEEVFVGVVEAEGQDEGLGHSFGGCIVRAVGEGG
ncbi:predicted protein [Sclerotinia sclerotiorum 1980 UF-70]|uniref:Uncharacterized protein n=2 Tax=Sclerotinia sclerotiorum (strain ATCC 18683 / 1980 / Ss-1) TaxID=665079 RepID=A7E8X8_SCLS1|nr:predicted protein [Sclerotinia sclerotiorum 1980 UF-70]APA05860.1 hypothetical protein sscle_01g006300 [Sclerotinia sclerotiorum 1980 UF-70]EDN96830.1 predicted protein [Sclerotinia sclerotiorum 1980 UF-70]